MNHKKLMLDTIQGRPTGCIPFVPRLDLWYRANKRNNSLPPKYKNASLEEIVRDLGLGFHAVIPNFRDLRTPDDDVHRALGIYNFWFMPYKTILNNIDYTVTHQGDCRTVCYRTPKGDISTETIYNLQMQSAGITITHISKYAAQTKNDLEVLSYIFENAQVEQNYAGYDEFKSQVGDSGLAVAYLNMAASGLHLVQRDLAPLDAFVYLSFDYRDQVTALESVIQNYLDKILDIVAVSSAELVLSGANYDASVTSPPFFEQHITPALKRQADTLHSKGKFLLTHTDGENTGLLEQYLACRIDIADSICPAPMTKLSLKQTRDVFGKNITIWGGIPSISVLEDSMADSEFFRYVDDLLDQIGNGDHIIFSIADTTPPAAKFPRIEHLAKAISSFGHIKM